MSDILIIGAGTNGLCAALLLARDGHRVTVLERDPAAPPAPELAWESWERRGCAQFRQPHYLLPPFRLLLEATLPDVAQALADAGAARVDVAAALPERVTGGRRDGDDRYAVLTARRPVLEAVLARAAAAEPGVQVHRGCPVRGLLTGPPTEPGVPHVGGVLTTTGEELRADVVVDASGRRGPVTGWLAGLGAVPPAVDAAPSGMAYYSRHFRAGSLPPLLGSLHQHHDSLSVLTLPGDHGTWAVVLCVAANDHAMRALREEDCWTRVAGGYPLAAPWLDAEPITGVLVMAGLEDRLVAWAPEGRPVVTGLLPLGDAWACTDPSQGRGTSIGLLHAALLPPVLRAVGGDDAGALSRGWDTETRRVVEPWHRSTVAAGRRRLAELSADRTGTAPPSDPPSRAATGLRATAGRDPDLLRAALDLASMLAQPADVFARPGLMARVTTLAAGAPRYTLPGPDRSGLLAAVAG